MKISLEEGVLQKEEKLARGRNLKDEVKAGDREWSRGQTVSLARSWRSEGSRRSAHILNGQSEFLAIPSRVTFI